MDALERLQLLETEMGESEKDVGKAVREQVEKKMEVKKRKEAEKAEKERRKKEGDKAIRDALAVRSEPLFVADPSLILSQTATRCYPTQDYCCQTTLLQLPH